MPKRSMLLLAAAAIAGGCTRDAPLVAPPIEAVDAKVTPKVGLASSARDEDVDAIEDALARLVPALDDHSGVLRTTLLKLNANKNNRAARQDLDDLLDQLTSTLPPQYRADLDALRLELGVKSK